MRKGALRRSYQLLQNLEILVELVVDCIAYLEAQGYNELIGIIVQDLKLEPTKKRVEFVHLLARNIL